MLAINRILLILIAASGVQFLAAAAASDYRLEEARNDITDIESLRSGAKLFVAQCQSCHGIEYLRYSRIGRDLQWSEEELIANLNMPLEGIYDYIISPLSPEQGEQAYGIAPPDLSLRSRVRGSDWMLTYLKGFYQDPDRPTGFNNTVFPQVSMPWLMGSMQGIQQPVYKEIHGEPKLVGLEITTPGSMGRKEFHNAMLDLTNFLEYAGEPSKIQRVQLGWKVMLFIAFFTFCTWLLKQEYWRDVRKSQEG